MIRTRLLSQCPSVQKVQGTLPEAELVVCTDTRAYRSPSMFIAYPGARNNPLNMLDSLLASGCPLVIYQGDQANDALVVELQKKNPKTCFVAVSDAVVFSQELATLHAKEWQKKGGVVFAISGSNGKTTHKEMLAHLLKAKLGSQVVATEKNNNNHLGVPLTLFNITDETKVCVLELGSNHPGEIKVLCDIAAPRAGLVTNIGATHLEFFGSEKKVFEEEGYLYEAVDRETNGKGFFLQNVDDEFLRTFKGTAGTKTFSAKQSADYNIAAEKDGVRVNGLLNVTLHNPHLTGAHNKQNMAVAWIIATSLFPEAEGTFTDAASDFRPTKNRSEWCEFQGKKIYLDAYNANPSSMQAALEGFFDWLKHQGVSEEETLIVLGDMNELGDGAPTYHQQVGAFIKRWPNTTPVFIGRFAANYVQGLGSGTSFAEASLFKGASWKQMTQGKTHIFIKGSRSLQLESLLAIT